VGIRDQPECGGRTAPSRHRAGPPHAVHRPNVMNLNEHHSVLDASMVANGRQVTETVKASLGVINNDDWRSYVKYPGFKGDRRSDGHGP